MDQHHRYSSVASNEDASESMMGGSGYDKSAMAISESCNEITGGCGHQMSSNDPDNPMNWSVREKLYISLAASFLTFT